MSIEQNLADLTAAVNNLTAVLQSKMMADAVAGTATVATTGALAEAGFTNIDPGQEEAGYAPKSRKAAAASAPPAATPATQATTDAASGDKPIDFTSQIQKPIVAMAAGGKREQALAILKELGAARASDIKPEDYAKAVELITKAG